MTSGRTILAQALTDALEGWQIVSDARQIDSVRQPGACVLWTSKRTRADLQGFDVMTDEITLWVLTATDKPALIEDDLDGLLMQVFEVLEGVAEFTWSEAERGVLADKFDGWRVTVTCTYKIENEGN